MWIVRKNGEEIPGFFIMVPNDLLTASMNPPSLTHFLQSGMNVTMCPCTRKVSTTFASECDLPTPCDPFKWSPKTSSSGEKMQFTMCGMPFILAFWKLRGGSTSVTFLSSCVLVSCLLLQWSSLLLRGNSWLCALTEHSQNF